MGYRSGCFSTRLHDWLAPQNGEHILDLCAAPGGKQRIFLRLLQRRKFWRSILMAAPLSRLRQFKTPWYEGNRKQGDGRYPSQWCGEQQFDRIY